MFFSNPFSFLPAAWQETYPNFYADVQFVLSQGGVGWNWQVFETLYRTSWLAERVVNCIADDMTEKWRVFEHPNPKIVEARTKFEEDNNIAELFNEAIRVARKYGGGCIQPLIRGQVSEEFISRQLDFDSIKKGDLINFHVLTRYDYAPFYGYNRDILVEPKLYGNFEYYTMIRIQTMMQGMQMTREMIQSKDIGALPIVHASWMCKFFGTKVDYYQLAYSGGWSDSVLLPLADKIAAVEQSFHLLFDYLDSFNIDYFKIPNLVGQLQAGKDSYLRKIVDFVKSLRFSKARFVDSNDTMERHQMTSIQNIVPVFDKQVQYIVGATGIPVTKILGSSVGGWSTGDNELTQYYDQIAQKQRELRNQLRFVDEIIERHLFGRYLGIQYKFPSKREMSETERLDNKLKEAQTFTLYTQMRVMTPEIVALNIKDVYTGITDEYISKLDDEFLDYEEGMADIPDDEEEVDKEPKDEEEKDNS